MGQTSLDRKREKKHVRSYKDQIDTDAWRGLSGSAVKVLLAMGLFENGDNNGEIFFSDRTGAELTGMSRHTVRRGLNELMETGFVYCSERGGFSRKIRHAATYGFTWLAGPKGSEHRAPSHAYKKWKRGENPRAQILPATGLVSNFDLETPSPTGPISGPIELEKPLVSTNPHLAETRPQTVSQGIGLTEGETDQRKQANPISGAFPRSLRDRLADHLNNAEPGEQSRLARTLGIPGGTLSKFINGRGLPPHHAERLAQWAEAR